MIGNIKQRAYNLLRASERYTKTDMVYATKGGFWLSVSTGVAVVVGLAVSVALANLIPPEVFGNYKFVLSLAGVISAFSLTGLAAAVVRSVARGHEGALRSGFIISLKWSAGIALLALGGSAYYYLNENVALAISLLMVGAFLPFTHAGALYDSYLDGKKAFKTKALYSFGRNILPALALTAALFLTDNPVVIVIVYFASVSLTTLYYYNLTLRRFKPTGAGDSSLTNYSMHLSVMGALGTVANHIDKVLVFHFLGAAPLAIYAFAVAPVDQLQTGKKILGTLALPKVSERPFAELQKTALRNALIPAFYALALAGAYALVAPYLYQLLYPQYTDSVIFSQLYSLTLLAIAGTVLQQILVAHKKKKELYLHRSMVPIVQLTLYLLLLPFFGLMGLIVTHVIARSFSSLLAYYFVQHPFDSPT